MSNEIKRPKVSSLWIGGALSYLELLSLRSMMHHGHEVTLYHYLPIENAPDWLNTKDANTILPISEEELIQFGSSFSIVANIFRYNLLAKTDEIWCDCDVYFLRPLPDDAYIFVMESLTPIKMWNNSLLRLPKDSPVLRDLIEMFSTFTPEIPNSRYFFHMNTVHRSIDGLEKSGGNGKVHLSKMMWGTSGPRALSYFIDKYDLGDYGWPSFLHSPIRASQIVGLARPRMSRTMTLPVNAQSIHFYGSTFRRRMVQSKVFKDNVPLKGSFMDLRLCDHGIDPESAPLYNIMGKSTHLENINSDDAS